MQCRRSKGEPVATTSVQLCIVDKTTQKVDIQRLTQQSIEDSSRAYLWGTFHAMCSYAHYVSFSAVNHHPDSEESGGKCDLLAWPVPPISSPKVAKTLFRADFGLCSILMEHRIAVFSSLWPDIERYLDCFSVQ